MDFREQLAQAYGLTLTEPDQFGEQFTLADIQSVCGNYNTVNRSGTRGRVSVRWCRSHAAYFIVVYPTTGPMYEIEHASPTTAMEDANTALHT